MNELKPAVLMFLLLTIICGGIYPVVVTGIAQVVFPKQAEGSFIVDQNGKMIGSSLIGQPFTDPKYFWPRPSATPEFGYNPAASSGSNAGPTNLAYLQKVGDRVRTLRDNGITGPIPADLVQASASGLDPHISPEAVLIQVPRVAKARGLSENQIVGLVSAKTAPPQLGIFGASRVNVLELNLALDRL